MLRLREQKAVGRHVPFIVSVLEVFGAEVGTHSQQMLTKWHPKDKTLECTLCWTGGKSLGGQNLQLS